MKTKLIISFFLWLNFSVAYSQHEIIKSYKSDSSDYELILFSSGKFNYERAEVNDMDNEIKPTTILKITNGDTLWLSSSNDIVIVENFYAGYWRMSNDTVIFTDTTWPKENLNWKICYAKVINEYALMNINFPNNKPDCILNLIYYYNVDKRWSFYGTIKNGIINGNKRRWDEKNNTLFIKKYENDIFSEKNFLF
jgi:hypothetical protein